MRTRDHTQAKRIERSVDKDVPAGALVCVGMIAAAHGVKGEVKVKSFTESAAGFASYGPLWDEAGGRRFEMTVIRLAKDGVIASIRGVTSRNAAEDLRGTRLFVPRAALPATDREEFYYADLIGLRAELADGTKLGEVTAIHNFGAGDIIEVKGKRALDLPFTREVVPVVDVAGGRIVVELPEGLIEAPEHGKNAAAKAGRAGGKR